METMTLVLYFLLTALLIILIGVGIKLFSTIDKLNKTIDDLQTKLDAIDPSFRLVNNVTNALNSFHESASYGFLKIASKLFNR